MQTSPFQQSQYELLTSFPLKGNTKLKYNESKGNKQGQIAKRILKQDEKRESVLAKMVFKEMSIEDISVNVNPCNQDFADILGCIEGLVEGNSKAVRAEMNKEKEFIIKEYLKVNQQHADYIGKQLAREEQLANISMGILPNFMGTFTENIIKLTEYSVESGHIEQGDNEINTFIKDIDLGPYEKVNSEIVSMRSQGSNVKESENAQKNESQQKSTQAQSTQPNQKKIKSGPPQRNQKYLNSSSQKDAECEEEEVKNGFEDSANQPKNNIFNASGSMNEKVRRRYSQGELNLFYGSVEVELIPKIFSICEDIRSKFDRMKDNLDQKVTLPIERKREKVRILFEFVRDKMQKFFCTMPRDYFGVKGQEALNYFQLSDYEKFGTERLNDRVPLKQIEAYGINLSLEDMKRLQKDALINDNILDLYASYLRQAHGYMKGQLSRQGNIQPTGDIVIFSHLFFETQFENLRIKQVEGQDFLNSLVPIEVLFDPVRTDRFGFIANVDLYGVNHWIFFGVFNTSREIVYYDSAAGSTTHFKNYTMALIAFFTAISGNIYTAKRCDPCPRQLNGTDCGMFVLKYMQNFAYCNPQTFNQDDVSAFRKKLHTFFPLLSHQLIHRRFDFELLQYYEGKICSKLDENNAKILSLYQKI